MSALQASSVGSAERARTVWYRSLALRTALAFLVSVAVLLAVFATGAWLAVRATALRELDGGLVARARAVAALHELEPDGRIESELSPLLAAHLGAGPAGGIAVYDERGGCMFRYGAGLPSNRAEGPSGASGAAAGFRWLALRFAPGDHERGVGDGAELSVVVSASSADVEARLRGLGGVLGVCSLATLAMGVLVAVWWARRVVRPLGALTAAAAREAAGHDPDVPRRGLGDEIDVLADALDEAFRVRREAFRRQARFTADAAHELRNPIAAMRTAAEVGRSDARTVAERQAFLADIEMLAARMGSTVEALLELSRLDATCGPPRQDVTDLGALAREVVAARGRGDQVEARVEGGPAAIAGDRRLLRILIDNLVGNAVHHARKQVTVRTRTDALGAVVLDVVDDGPGPGDGDTEVLFERFRRRRARTGGAGLGLSIVAAVARAHGGSVGFVPIAEGAMVRVVFPTVLE